MTTRHALPKSKICHILASYKMCFCQNNCVKKRPKSPVNSQNSTIFVKIHISYCWNPQLPAISIFGKKQEKFSSTRWGFSSGSLPKCDILDIWQKLANVKVEFKFRLLADASSEKQYYVMYLKFYLSRQNNT